jgi:hypothetical protein
MKAFLAIRIELYAESGWAALHPVRFREEE